LIAACRQVWPQKRALERALQKSSVTMKGFHP